MPAEKFANTTETTLSAAVDAVATSIAVAAAAPVALQGGQFRVRVDDELMLVTATGAAGASPWTVVRGVEGSTAATHASAAKVTHVLTSGSLANAASAARKFRAGKYYIPWNHGNDNTVVLDINLVRALPFPVGRIQAFDRICIEVTGAIVSSTVRLGVYEAETDGMPGELLFDAGTVDSSTTGVKEAVIAQTIPTGMWWVCAVAQGGQPTVRGMDLRSPYVAYPTAGNSNAPAHGMGGVTGALPSTFTPGAGTSNGHPKIMLRAV